MRLHLEHSNVRLSEWPSRGSARTPNLSPPCDSDVVPLGACRFNNACKGRRNLRTHKSVGVGGLPLLWVATQVRHRARSERCHKLLVANEPSQPLFRRLCTRRVYYRPRPQRSLTLDCENSASGRTAFHGRSSFPRIGLAATVASPALCLLQIRVDNDTPSFAAITCVAPGVRFSDLAIFVTPALALAIVFICRTSSLVHSRRAIFLGLTIVTPVFVDRSCITRLRIGNREGYETRTRPRLRISSGR
jgi:hypothetical protein